MLTGLAEGRRAPVAPGDKHYPLAVFALERQDTWTAEAHGAYWTAALCQWPAKSGRRRTAEDLAVAAALLDRAGLSLREIAETLGVEPDTLHARAGSGRSPDVGEDTLRLREAAEEPQGVRLRRGLGHLWEPEWALPRVYLDGTDAPEDGFLSPLVELLPGSLAVSPHGTRYLELADAKRRELWSAQRSRDPALEWAERERASMVAVAEPL